MSVLVDTGVLVGFRNPRDERHAQAVKLVQAIQDGEHGDAFTSDYIFDEAIGLAMARSGRADVVRAVGELVLPEKESERWLGLLHVSPEEFLRAWASVKRHENARLSFTDWTIVEMARSRGISIVASFDSGLDAWVARIS